MVELTESKLAYVLDRYAAEHSEVQLLKLCENLYALVMVGEPPVECKVLDGKFRCSDPDIGMLICDWVEANEVIQS